MLKRLKYISRFAGALSTKDIRAIVEVSQRNNFRDGITGALTATGGVFFQIIEGPREEVEQLYRKILMDARHTEVMCLRSEDNCPTRLFPNWSMRHIPLDEESESGMERVKELMEPIRETMQLLQEQSSELESSIWREFAKTS